MLGLPSDQRAQVHTSTALLTSSDNHRDRPPQAGKIFDFNLTLPLMAGQFLLLMVFLDKTWFGPVGKLLEDRDAELRSKLGAFRDNR